MQVMEVDFSIFRRHRTGEMVDRWGRRSEQVRDRHFWKWWDVRRRWNHIGLVFHPVIHVVELEALPRHGFSKEATKHQIVGLRSERQVNAVRHVRGELWGQSTGQNVHTCFHLFGKDCAIFFCFCLACQPLPRQRTTQEVDQHVTQRLQVVPPALFKSKVCVDRRVSCSALETAIFSIRDVPQRARVTVVLRQSKVNCVDKMIIGTQTHEKILGLDISVQVMLRVNVFQS